MPEALKQEAQKLEARRPEAYKHRYPETQRHRGRDAQRPRREKREKLKRTERNKIVKQERERGPNRPAKNTKEYKKNTVYSFCILLYSCVCVFVFFCILGRPVRASPSLFSPSLFPISLFTVLFPSVLLSSFLFSLLGLRVSVIVDHWVSGPLSL